MAALYQQHGGDYLPIPDVSDVVEAGDDGFLFVIEEVMGSKSTRIRAAAGLFQVADCPGAGSEINKIFEVAGMVVAESLRGYGVQRLMLALRALVLAREHSKNAVLMASVVVGNENSSRNVTKQRFVQVTTPAWLKVDRIVCFGWLCLVGWNALWHSTLSRLRGRGGMPKSTYGKRDTSCHSARLYRLAQ